MHGLLLSCQAQRNLAACPEEAQSTHVDLSEVYHNHELLDCLWERPTG